MASILEMKQDPDTIAQHVEHRPTELPEELKQAQIASAALQEFSDRAIFDFGQLCDLLKNATKMIELPEALSISKKEPFPGSFTPWTPIKGIKSL